MLDDLTAHLDAGKTADLLGRLRDKRPEQVLPVEIELALLWGLSRLGDVEIEPEWWGGASDPDAYSEALIPGEPAIIEIAATSDDAISGESDMDRIAERIGTCADGVRKGASAHLYFSFAQESGYENGRYFRRRLAPRDYALSPEARALVEAWIRSSPTPSQKLRLVEPGLDVVIEKSAHRQTRFHNTWSAMPPETHSLERNPLFALLRRKAGQLRDAPQSTRRVIFLGDAGSTLLSRIGAVGEIDPTGRAVSGREIIGHFVQRYAALVDLVVVFTPSREQQLVGGTSRFWNMHVFRRPGFNANLSPLATLHALLPPPLVDGHSAKSLFRQGMFDPKAMGVHLPPRITGSVGGPMEYKFSARALIDLLAGRVDAQTFVRETGGLALEKNLFAHWLDRGMTIRDARFESGGLDEDDDYLIFTFADDAGARDFRAASKNKSADPGPD